MRKSDIKDNNILKILEHYDVELNLPNKVIDELSSIPQELSKSDVKNRVDLRDLLIFTIDGDDTKDIDDAISIKKLSNGNFYLGVHIADVSHYVKEKSSIDKMALEQATSIYPVNCVVPMLPKELSNGICSLNPNVDRLTLSCFMEIDYSGTVVNYNICKSVIRSSYQLTYSVVNDILENKNNFLNEKYIDIYDTLKLFEKLTKILINKREKRGSLDLTCPETKFICDADFNVVKVKPYERNIATRLIEECMIICNETIAEHCYKKELPFLYRIHDNPDEEKMQAFRDFVYLLDMKLKDRLTSKELQKVLLKIKNTPEELALNQLLLRSLPKAVYSSNLSSHFGLASKCYCHFTSPIRRYPDLQIHRIIKMDLDNKFNELTIQKYRKIMSSIDVHCSNKEQLAQKIERETHKLKAAEYFSNKLDHIYEGVISGISENGFYVQLPNTLEGFVNIYSLKNDKYIFDNCRLRLVGEKERKIFSLGNIVLIKIKKVNLENYQVDFELIS